MIAIIHGGMKKNNICALFCSAYFVVQSRMTIAHLSIDAN
jgi:hypothetical protein